MKHRCVVPGCDKMVSGVLLMCRPHWRLLDMDFRSHLWNAYRKRERDKGHQRAYLSACREAIERVLSIINQKEPPCHSNKDQDRLQGM